MTFTPTVLVVDDERRILAIVRHFLESEGYAVKIASDGQAGIEAALAGPVDLVLLDMALPPAGGHAVWERLRSEPATARLPIIPMTAAAHPSGLQGTAIPKPFTRGQLIATVKQALRASGDPDGRPETTA